MAAPERGLRDRERLLADRFPEIPWVLAEPVSMLRAGVPVTVLTCRFCTAFTGLAPGEVAGFEDDAAFQEHLAAVHCGR